MAIYGFAASVLPVWVLLCPRDYLSSFLKIGTLALLVLGVIIAHPTLHAPALNYTFLSGGPIVKAPDLSVCVHYHYVRGDQRVSCLGQQRHDAEDDLQGDGCPHDRLCAMLVEGLVAVVALIAAASLPSAHYYHMNTMWKDLPTYQRQIEELAQKEDQADVENKQPVSLPLVCASIKCTRRCAAGRAGR